MYNAGEFYFTNYARNVGPSGIQSYTQSSQYAWGGLVDSGYGASSLPVGQYRIRFSALKHFGNISNPNDFQVYRTPLFNLVY